MNSNFKVKYLCVQSINDRFRDYSISPKCAHLIEQKRQCRFKKLCLSHNKNADCEVFKDL